MGLITTEVEILVHNRRKYWEEMGYKLPKVKDKDGKVVVPKGTKIKVKVEDMSKGSAERVKVECDNCSKLYTLNYNKYLKQNHDGKIYCNYCKSKILNSGENNYKYNSNITDEEREIQRNNSQNVAFIKKVLRRDNYTCQCCDKKINHDGIAHHLDGWDNFKEKRYDDKNGITLCKTCHKNFHSIYGYGNNTKEQFEEWIGHVIGELEKYNGELPTARKVICLETGRIYDSAEKCAKEYNGRKNPIYNVCNHSTFKNKKNIEYEYKTYKKQHFLYLDEYEKMTKQEIKECFNKSLNYASKSIICLNDNKIYNSISDACKELSLCHRSIVNCCDHKTKYYKTLNGDIYNFMYIDEYMKVGEGKYV